MAVVHAKQTGAAVTGSLTISAASVGNELVVLVSQQGSTSAPNVQFSIGVEGASSAGVTVESTHAVFLSSADSIWLAHKVAVGGETGISVTPAAGGTIQGVSCVELSGTYEIESIFHTDNIVSGKTGSSPSVTTLNANDVIFAGLGSVAASGAPSAWTGTGPLTNVETVSTRVIGGYYIPGATLSGVTFTANWETAHQTGLLGVVLRPIEASAARSAMVF